MNSNNIHKKKRAKKRLFDPPWKYREGFLVALALLIAGFVIELLTPQAGISIPAFPFNMYAGLAFIATIVFLHAFNKNEPAVRWLSTIPAATSAICLITMLTILMGVFHQGRPDETGLAGALGLTHIKNSWTFFMSQLYVLTSLGLVVLRRSIPLKRKNIGFIFNHAGLWIVIAAASLGTGDLLRMRMELHKGEPLWHAVDNNGNLRHMPFALDLAGFTIEEYPPQLAIIDSHTGEISDPDQLPLPYIEEGKTITLLNWSVSVEEFHPMARKENDSYVYSEDKGAPPVAKVRAYNELSGEMREGWISCGSFKYDTEFLWLDGRNLLVMTLPEPKKYQSTVIVRTMQDEPEELVIEVNNSPKVKGWRLYQLSYDQSMGKWSDISILEVVRDPWLPLVYFGFFMLFAGAIYIFWIGKEPSAGDKKLQ